MKRFTVKINKKGQIKIPKYIRNKLGLEDNSPVELEFDKEEKSLKIKQPHNILSLAGMSQAPEGKNALKSREEMENNYERF